MEAAKLKVEISESGKVLHQATFRDFPVLFGRNPECHLRLRDSDFVSRVHGSISLDRDQIIVTDLGSLNGLSQGGKRVQSLKNPKVLDFQIRNLNIRLELEGQEARDVEKTAITVIKPPPSDGIRFSIAPIPGISEVPADRLALQGVVTWQDGIYDVRNYSPGERLMLGPSQTAPIYLPITAESLDMGVFGSKGAKIRLRPSQHWKLYRDKHSVTLDQLNGEKKLTMDSRKNQVVTMGLNEVLSIDLSSNVTLHFRYVKSPRFVMKRTLIENREEFKKAIGASLAVHLLVSLVAMMSAPKTTAPQIDNVPPRIAKLLVEPPSQMLAAKPPEPPPPPPPPPPEEKKPEPPPPPKKPAVVPKTKNPIKRIVTKQPASPRPAPTKVVEAPPQPTAQEKEQQELANLLSSLPAPPSGGSANKGNPILISKDRIAPGGMKVGGIAAVAGASSPPGQVHGTAEPGFKVGSGGAYSGKSLSGKTGKRAIGGVVVGTPDLSPKVGRTQGLSDEEVMKVVNKHLGDVQRCYERALFEDSSLAGRVEYEWEIGAPGSVISARVQRSEIARGDSLNNCVLALLRKMKFPAAKNGQSTIAKIGFPFGRN
ncbi:MAG: AgmX/PglI C-terminal domain-containing protein [Bdellovibrionaceae bacterium]|nr:AgmX/PglI C-terminal domain-containing protein [Pseudobdellovibrionaceae bacterium]MBX3033273.1 AgmX/PglI C-terminal domain-containing protein [Pseudobdellovibrionaceae bacterium]